MTSRVPASDPMPGACDCHIHIFEPAYPLTATATFTPPPAPLDDYRKVQQALGLTRAVVVQPTGYEFDNRCTLAALAALGPNGRGVAVVDASASDETLAQLHAAGIRGVRFMMLAGGVLPWDMLEPVAARIAPLGWHIDLQIDGAEFPVHEARLARLPVPLVIDHNGKFLNPPATTAPEFRSLFALLDRGRCWVKLSAPYETSRDGPPAYEDVSALAAALAAGHPERCLWASNWPHPNRVPRPKDADLLELLRDWAPDTSTYRRILVDNPKQLYGF
ncbi:MAG: amidohydrolase family protein [Polaromonas sp.]